MKIRHTAALALVGWCLMIPPAIPGTYEVNQSTPLSAAPQRQVAGKKSERDAIGLKRPHLHSRL